LVGSGFLAISKEAAEQDLTPLGWNCGKSGIEWFHPSRTAIPDLLVSDDLYIAVKQSSVADPVGNTGQSVFPFCCCDAEFIAQQPGTEKRSKYGAKLQFLLFPASPNARFSSSVRNDGYTSRIASTGRRHLCSTNRKWMCRSSQRPHIPPPTEDDWDGHIILALTLM
jgi:hypothetical protein